MVGVSGGNAMRARGGGRGMGRIVGRGNERCLDGATG